MSEEATVYNKSIRESILEFENTLLNLEGTTKGDSPLCPLKHSFAEGMYVREIFIPKGMILTGKIHKHSHPNFLLKGKVKVVTESGGYQILEAPMSIISVAGTKRAVHALEDTVWVTVHLNESNTADLNKIEKYVIAESYEDYDKFKSLESKPIKKFFINFVKKYLP